ncbi:MAG: GTP-binding protein [Asgard group archaeon]|nr:GTP-binding protein [Asgard group archaeon]
MEEKKSSDFLWKIVLCGDSFVGKTTIRKRAMGEHFAEEYISTVGADFSSYKLKLGDLMIGFQVWDLAGQDKYKYIRSSFYGGATGCFLVFDTTNPKSMKSLSTWVDEAIRYSNGTIEIFVICANKVDLLDQREITEEMGEKYAQALKESSGLQCEYIETSALTGENIDIAFDLMAKCLLEREGIRPIKHKEEYIEPIKTTEIEQPTKPIAVEQPTPDSMKTLAEEPIEVTEAAVAAASATIVIEDDDSEETERLIAEVMAVLSETDEVIIGREITDQGEKAITVPKKKIEKERVIDEKPRISSELENVLIQINQRLDSLTQRLKGLEVEISQVKVPEEEEEVFEEELEDIDETLESIVDVRDELGAITPLASDVATSIEEEEEEFDDEIDLDSSIEEEYEEEPITTTEVDESFNETKILTEEERLNKDQEVLESLLTEPVEPSITIEEEQKDEKISVDEKSIQEPNIPPIEQLVEIPGEELIDIPDEEPLVSLDKSKEIPTKEDDTGVIGTELSSAMISELKDMSEEEENESEEKIQQSLKLDQGENKRACPICGEEVKYIRQYNKYYCVKCGRYLI